MTRTQAYTLGAVLLVFAPAGLPWWWYGLLGLALAGMIRRPAA